MMTSRFVSACARNAAWPARLAVLLLEPRLDVEVDVLQLLAEGELPALDLGADLLQPAHDRLRVVAGDDRLLRQHAGVRYGGGEIVGVEPPVEGDGGGGGQGPAIGAAGRRAFGGGAIGQRGALTGG